MGALDSVLGALVIGSWVNSMVFALELQQLYYYFTTFKNDGWSIKGAVATIGMLDLGSTVVTNACVYLYTVKHWGDVAYLTCQNWPLPVMVITNALTGLILHAFLTVRVWHLSRSIALVLVCSLLTICAIAAAIAVATVTILNPTYHARTKIIKFGIVWLSTACGADSVIAASLVTLLNKARKDVANFSQSTIDRPLQKLVRISAESGCLIATYGLITICVFATHESTNIPVGLALSFGRIYALTLLFNLNLRKSTARGIATSGGELDTTSGNGNGCTASRWSRGDKSRRLALDGVLVSSVSMVEIDDERDVPQVIRLARVGDSMTERYRLGKSDSVAPTKEDLDEEEEVGIEETEDLAGDRPLAVEVVAGECADKGEHEQEVHSEIYDALVRYLSSGGPASSGGPPPNSVRRYYWGDVGRIGEWKQACIALANHLLASPSPLPSSILEVGAGVGLLSLVCARILLGQEEGQNLPRVVATDVDESVLERLEGNVELNGVGKIVKTRKLDWELAMTEVGRDALIEWEGGDRPELILGADVVYDPSLAAQLAQTLAILLRRRSLSGSPSSPAPPGPIALIAGTIRNQSTWDGFLEQCTPKPNGGEPDERTSLLTTTNQPAAPSHTYHNDIVQPVPTVAESLKALFFSGYLNILLVAVPLSFLSHFLNWGSTADFIISFIAIVPLASLLGDATEQCSLTLGQTVGGLMNATFGNAVEAIVGIIALVKGELRIVQTSMLGSILSNLLLVLGCSFFAGGLRFSESTFQATAAQASSSLMLLACSTLIIPAAYHASRLSPPADGILAVEPDRGSDLAGLLTISRGTSIILLLCYGSYLYFQLKSHAYLFEDEAEHEEEEAKMELKTAIGALVVITVITSFCADYLVGAIDEFAKDFGIPKAFIGLILLPIVGNAAEHVTSVWMAMKGKMELTIGVSVGSSIQIAVGVIPLLVVVGWIIDQPLTLFFENFETLILFVSVLLVNLLIQDGRSNYLEGVMLGLSSFLFRMVTGTSC
ncbi:calcium:hydrogen antiporter [Pseudohyphozyma bogoriensis]|nr:calcium:hydrogen antiporter [Pseudohyphozyma bogoriensis]